MSLRFPAVLGQVALAALVAGLLTVRTAAESEHGIGFPAWNKVLFENPTET